MRTDYVCPIIGKRRSGKSTLLHGDPDNPDAPSEGIVDWTSYARVFILDPHNDWERGLVFTSIRDFHRALKAVANGNDIPDGKRWIFRPRSRKAVTGFFELLAPNWQTGKPGVPGLLILDEASEYMTSHSVDEGLMRVVQIGGNSDQSVILVARTWNQLNVQVRTQRDVVVSFRGPREDTIKQWEKSLDREARAVQHLEDRQFCILGEQRVIDWYDKAAQRRSFVDLSD